MLIVESHSLITPSEAESIAVMRATSLPDTGVNAVSDEQFEREMRFQTAVSFIDTMLRNGVISENDYHQWREKLVEKYNPPVGKIVSNRRGKSVDFQAL